MPSFPSFSIGRLPRIEFGAGTLRKLPEIAAGFGRRLMLVTGQSAFAESDAGRRLFKTLADQGFETTHLRVAGEPSPAWVDEQVQRHAGMTFDVVIGIGGGSPLDAAKALAGLLAVGDSVMDYLEGAGPEKPYEGPALPFIAVPTTAGTGSEATRNAVLSTPGETGFKKSFRDEQLVPAHAIVDPDLLSTCPPELIAANGMDAFTQLMESYVSLRANPFTDALAWSGIEAAAQSLPRWHDNPEDRDAAARMAYAALVSGICLAHTGLGSVHGLAAPLGAFFPIPHGVACGTLVAEATRLNIDALETRDPDSPALEKYAELGKLFRQKRHVDPVGARVFLVHTLTRWTEKMQLPRLGAFGVATGDIPRIVAHSRGSSMQTNPIVLTDEEIGQLLSARL